MHEERMLRLKQVLELVPVSKSTIWDWVKKGMFPQPIRLGSKTTCWKMSDIQQYLQSAGV